MNVLAFPCDQAGCGEYRISMIGRALAVEGVSIDVAGPNDHSKLYGTTKRGQIQRLFLPEATDVVIFQRPTNIFMAQAVSVLRHQGVTVIVDVDDDLRHIHPQNSAYWGYHPRTPNGHSFLNTEDACRRASLVTVTTPALAKRYGGHGRVAVLPNCVPKSYLDVEHTDSDVVGWAGSASSHPDDLQAVGNAFARLDCEFLHVGDDNDPIRQRLGLRHEPKHTGLIDLADWPAAVTRIGIGIAPLARSVFNSGKSHLKPLEMSAVGVPWIASDVVEYRRLHEMGCGLVAAKPKEWERHLRSLLASPALRLELSETGRAVAGKMTVEGNAWRWFEAWERARDFDKQKEMAT